MRKKAILVFGLIIFTSLLYGWLFSIKKGNPYIYNSDYLLYVVSGRDIFGGNIALSEWYGSTNTFYGLALLYGIVGYFWGYDPMLIVVTSAILFALVSVCICYIVWSTSKTDRLLKTLFVYALLIAGFGNYKAGIYAGTHVDISLLTIIYFYVISRIDFKSIKWIITFVIVSILMLVGFISDSLLIVYTVIPIGVVIISLLLLKRHRGDIKPKMVVFIILLIELVLARCIMKAWNGIALTHKIPISTIESGELFARIMAAIQNLLYMFGVDVFNQIIDLSYAGMFIGGAICVYLVVLYIKQMDEIMNSDLYYYCASTVVVSVALMIFTTYNKMSEVPYSSMRMLYCAYFCILVLLSRINLGRVKYGTIDPKMIIGVLVVFFVCHGVLGIDYGRKIISDNKYSQTVEYFNSKGLDRVLCSYWTSYPIMVESNYRINAIPITGPNPCFFDWNAKKTGELTPIFSLVLEEEGFNGLDYDNICRSIGEPSEHVKFENINIYTWTYDISPYIRNIKKDKSIYTAQSYNYTKKVSDGVHGVIMHSGTIAFGPYEKLSPGKYKLTCEGEKLDKVLVDVYSKKNQNDIMFSELSKMGNKSEVLFDLKRDVDDVEFRLFNETGGDILFKEMRVERVSDDALYE